jgi:serine/threonine-protein kinase
MPKLSLGAKQAIVYGLQMVAPRRPQTVAEWLDRLNSQEKISGPQLIPTQRSISQPSAEAQVPTLEDSVQADLKSALIKCKIPQRGQEKPLIPQPTLAQSLVTQSEPENRNRRFAPKKTKTPNIKWLLQALLMTGAIATSAGLGFGFALRINGSAAPGSTILHTKQSFPPSSHWPKSEPQIEPSL